MSSENATGVDDNIRSPDTTPSLVHRIAVHVAVIASYVLIALIHLRPLAFKLTETIPRAERMDALLHGWIINWTARQLFRAPWDLFQANLFFPHPNALAYTEHMVPEALPAAPVWALTHDPVLTYNVAYLLTFVLGGWGTFLLVRRLTGNAWAAWVAGAFACYFPAKRWSLAHINTISVHGVPFAMLALHRLLVSPRLLRAIVAGAAVALASLVSAYYTVYLPLILVLGVPLIWWAGGWSFDRSRIIALTVAALATAAIAIPILFPYLQIYSGGAEPARAYELQIAGGVDVAEFFIVESLLWSPILLPQDLDPLTTPFFPGLLAILLATAALLGRRNGEPHLLTLPDVTSHNRRGVRNLGFGGLGLLIAISGAMLVDHHRDTLAFREGSEPQVLRLLLIALVSVALIAAIERRDFPLVLRNVWRRFVHSPRMSRAYAAMFAASLIIALGPRLKFFGFEGPPLPYHLIYYWVPGASALRAPYRAAILGQAFLAILIGFGAAWLLSRERVRRAHHLAPAMLAIALVTMMVGESVGDALPLDDLPLPAAAAYQWLADQPGDFGILELPTPGSIDRTARNQWLSTLHWKRRTTGHNGRLPDDIHQLHDQAGWPPQPQFLNQLRDRFPLRYVLVHLNRLDPEPRRRFLEETLPEQALWWVPERQFGDALVLRMRNGGPGRNFERRFAGWMVRGEMVVELADAVPGGGTWRIGISVDDVVRTTGPDVLSSGQKTVAVDLPEHSRTDGPIWVRIDIEGPNGQTIPIESVTFRTPEGLIYP